MLPPDTLPENIVSLGKKSFNNCWKLSSITAPSGRKVTFSYNYIQDVTQLLYQFQPKSSYSYCIFNGDFYSTHSSMMELNRTMLYSCPIRYISIDNGSTKMEFNYIATSGELRNKIQEWKNENVEIRVMDSNDIEKERGITILKSPFSGNSMLFSVLVSIFL